MRSSRPSTTAISRHGLLLPLLVSLLASAPAFADPAMEWVQKMSDAMRNLNYRGNFVYLHENQLESMQIEHFRDNKGEKERLLSLNGEAREVIRDDQSLTCIWPSSREVVVDLSRKNSYSPIFIPDDIKRLEKFYAMKLLGMPDISHNEIVFAGDNPYTDITGANGVGMQSAWVHMGRKYPSDAPEPSLTIVGVNDLREHLEL